jgi:formate dehydrogenase (NADP+) beta subunit
VKPTKIENPEYFHRVIDCQYACPSHTPVPEYIRLITDGRYDEAYMVNWVSNVFPGILGRICDRPCEPACRRGRVEKEPVAICRLKRVAGDFKGSIKHLLPAVPDEKNGKTIALIGGGPASLTVARDLLPLGYQVDLFDNQASAGGFIRTQVPSFRLPEEILDEEVNYILDMGVNCHFNHYVTSLKEMLDRGYDAIFIGTGAPRGRDLPDLPGRREGDAPSMSASTGWPRYSSAMSPASANGYWSSAAATPPWTAAAPPGGWAARMCGWWSAARAPK